MDKILGKIGIYDLIARGLTGIVVFVIGWIMGIFNIPGLNELINSIPIWAVLIAGYFCGLVLEELSYIFEQIIRFRKRLCKRISSRKEYAAYNYKDCENKLISDGFQETIDEPLTHIVMSSALAIAFTIFLIMSIVVKKPIPLLLLLVALIFVFCYRYYHYSKRRIELIFRLYIAKYGNNTTY